MYHLTQSKGGISSIELGRRLGVTQTTAWKIKHKLMQVMMERDATKRLAGRIEIDDAYLGGERTGGKRGRGSSGKTPIVVAVETTPQGQPIRLKLRRVNGFRQAEIASLAKYNFDPASTVISDGCTASTLSATPAAIISRSSPDPAARLHRTRRSSGSTGQQDPRHGQMALEIEHMAGQPLGLWIEDSMTKDAANWSWLVPFYSPHCKCPLMKNAPCQH